MDFEIQKQHENMDVFDMIRTLKTLYQDQAMHGRFDVTKALLQTKLSEGIHVGSHVLKIIGYVENLE